MLLRDKVAVVSGIGPGLGRELAAVLARHGADLVLAARSEGALAALARELAPTGRRIEVVPTDVTRAEDCARLAHRAREAFGRVDVLVNNAFHPGAHLPIEQDDLESFRAPFEVNVLGGLRLTKALLPLLRASDAGSVVMINSMIIRQPLPTMAGYASSKAALLVATQTLAREIGSSGVRVNSVVPGYIWGPALEGYFAAQAKARGVDPRVVYEEVAREIALGRIPTSAEVAEAVVFFASDLSRAVSGASLDVNGGHVFH
jgi:NAD(P)-dependent dehydrogenase (short-subunit alcohol dehydrogenase family)